MTERRAYAAMILTVPLVWMLAVQISGLPRLVLPPPALVAQVLWEERGPLLAHTATTLFTALLGYLLANAVALALAIGSLHLRWLEPLTTPWVVLLKNIPFVALASLLIITLGDNLLSKLVIVVLICFHPILANLNQGLKSVDPVLLDRMATLNASRWAVFRHVRWPAAQPYYLAAHEIAFTASIVGAIIGEWFFSRKGLGFVLVQATTEFRGDRLYAAVLISSLLSIAAYWICRAARGRNPMR
jgi:NitT/TauT family transport system permease protein